MAELFFEMGVQDASRGGDKYVRLAHQFFNNAFNDCHISEYFDYYSGFAVLVRVAGEGIDFEGGSGPERLRTDRDQVMILDMIVPVSVWRDNDEDGYKKFFSASMLECFEEFIRQAKKKNRITDETSFRDLVRRKLEGFNEASLS